MANKDKHKTYDLEDRTLNFGKKIINMVNNLAHSQVNYNLINQVMRSGGSIGANYREANETITSKDFKFRIRICKKEAKETVYWLDLIAENNKFKSSEIKLLAQEADEFVRIFAAILKNSKCNQRFSA